MLSRTAIDSLEELIAEGLTPSPSDIIRLNAMGLKLEAIRARRSHDCGYFLPRVALIAPDLYLREPTVGHDIWFDTIRRHVDVEDPFTVLAVKCYALTRDADELPDPNVPTAIKTAIDAFCAEMKDFTQAQLWAALDYVLHGCDPASGEQAPELPKREADGTRLEDWDECVALGILHEGQALLYGVTKAEMRRMTFRHLTSLIHRVYALHDLTIPDQVARAERDYYATLDEIAARLRAAAIPASSAPGATPVDPPALNPESSRSVASE